MPHFDFGDIVYASCTQNNLDRLQKMQNQAARIISGSSHHTHRNDMYADLNWLSLKNRHLMHKCIIVYKCLNGIASQYLNDKITCNDNVHKYYTRSAKDLNVKNLTLQYYARSFEVSGTMTYNNHTCIVVTFSNFE